MIVRRSKSSAILPLRKHLIEKSLAQQQAKAIDEEQFYYQQKQKERLRIRPIEEVLEETKGENMDVDQTPTRQVRVLRHTAVSSEAWAKLRAELMILA